MSVDLGNEALSINLNEANELAAERHVGDPDLLSSGQSARDLVQDERAFLRAQPVASGDVLAE